MATEVPVVRSIVAVGAGFFASTVMSLGGDIAFRRLSPHAFDTEGHPAGDSTLLTMLGYETLFAVVAGYVTARIALRRPLFHALAAGTVILVARAFAVILTWDSAPAWFQLGTLLLIVPAALLGAKLGELRLQALR